MKHYLSLATVMIMCMYLHDSNAVATNLENSHSNNERELSSRIIGGKRANATRYPYFTFLNIFVQSGEVYDCGGSLVHSDVVLTAAHCFVDELDPAVSIKVYVNYTERIISSNLTEYVYVRDAKVWIPHKKYNGTSLQNDIALIILDKPVLEVSPVKRNNAAIVPPDGKPVTAIGHGDVSLGETPKISKRLMEVNISVSPFDDCQDAWVNDGMRIFNKSMICAGVSSGIKSACFGDSGGPLLIVGNNDTDDVQVGLTSFGYDDCSSIIFPNVFTRLSYYKMWMNDVICQYSSMKPNSCKTFKPTRKPTKPLVTSHPTQKPKPLPTSVPTRKKKIQ